MHSGEKTKEDDSIGSLKEGTVAKKSTKEKFMDDAEKLLRDSLLQRPDLLVWRGQYPHKHITQRYDHDTLLVGVSDDLKSKEPPTMIFAEIWQDEVGGVYYGVDTDLHCHSGRCPFGGGHNPMTYVEEIIEAMYKVPSINPA
jgi:hypothetical protein